MSTDAGQAAIKLVSVEGIWRLLLRFAGVSAEERGQGSMEFIDLIVAIYIVDLEHIVGYWDDWRNFETFVLNVPLLGGRRRPYLHRLEHMFRVWNASREAAGQLTFYPPPSADFLKVVDGARELAHARGGESFAPTSLDFLYSICCNDPPLSDLLQKSGLRFQELKEAVRGAPA
jgi:hypothetical protein